MFYVNILGRTKQQQRKVDAELAQKGSLWIDWPELNTFWIPFYVPHLRNLARFILNKTAHYYISEN